MSASLSTSLRADYGRALDRCVAIFGRADQYSAGAEGAPYRLIIEGFGVCFIVRRWKECGCFYLRALFWLLATHPASGAPDIENLCSRSRYSPSSFPTIC
eukprot:scaffold4002_cov123-Isochrysis_galbana.AAC.12